MKQAEIKPVESIQDRGEATRRAIHQDTRALKKKKKKKVTALC